MMNDLNDGGTCEVSIEVLTILVNVGKSSGKHNFNSNVAIHVGSNSHDLLGE